MRYRLKPKRALGSELRSLYRSLNENLALALLMACRDPERGIHLARRCCKELRALIRLLGGGAANQRFYRSLAAGLSAERDTAVMPATWQMLQANMPLLQAKAFHPVGHWLAELAETPAAPDGREAMFLGLAQEAEARCHREPEFEIPEGITALELRVAWVYRRARRAQLMARKTGVADDFHRFRRRSKDLYYSLRFLKPLMSAPGRRLVGQLKALTELQGLANDVAVLDEYLAANADRLKLTQVSWNRLRRGLIMGEQQLQAEVYERAGPILAAGPAQFVRTLKLSG